MSEPFGIELDIRQCEIGEASVRVQKAVAARLRERTSKLAQATEHIASLEQEIDRLRKERRWIPVGERLPDLNEANRFHATCLVACSNGNVCEMDYEINTYAKHERHRQPRWKWQGRISIWEVTHWQPLPPGFETKEV